LTRTPVYISGAGIISGLGSGLEATEAALRANRTAIGPLTLFDLLQGEPLPVGQISGLGAEPFRPRTHQLAHIAASQAMAGSSGPPDAVIVGTTTGGIGVTEELLRHKVSDKALYRYHGLQSVAEGLAQDFGCIGPALAVSTACSSGAVALALALAWLRSGRVNTVLAGGVDALSRLTYFGFYSLQLVDRSGCKPFDINRQGLAVGEGAGMLLLTTIRPERPFAQLLGAGLSCDAYHAAAPHPEGQGAFAAMQRALADAGLQPEDIDYINLHGTGTPDNDLAESKAVRRIFAHPPPLSSIKGACGHCLAGAGGVEAVVSMLVVSRGFLPANTGLQTGDPLLGLAPLSQPLERPVRTVLSNSFGFGGNNGALVIGAADNCTYPATPRSAGVFAVHGYGCLSGAGNTAATMARIACGAAVAGMADIGRISENLPPQLVRRLKRLPRLTLALADAAHRDAGGSEVRPGSVFMGTGWGALTETYDFLDRLASSQEQFPSPTDFVGSVHNAPAGQAAIMFAATGPNLTVSGGDYSFEQALLAADLLYDDPHRPALLLAADEGHTILSPLLDASITPGAPAADGGGAFSVSRHSAGAKLCLSLPFFASCQSPDGIQALCAALGPGLDRLQRYSLVLIGIPAAMTAQGEEQWQRLQEHMQIAAPVVRYRRFTGEFASASALATVFAASFLENRNIPGAFIGGADIPLTESASILILGLGRFLTAMELYVPPKH